MVAAAGDPPSLRCSRQRAIAILGVVSIGDLTMLSHGSMRKVLRPALPAVDGGLGPAGVRFGYDRKFDAVASVSCSISKPRGLDRLGAGPGGGLIDINGTITPAKRITTHPV